LISFWGSMTKKLSWILMFNFCFVFSIISKFVVILVTHFFSSKRFFNVF
jgi:hypothetical protein